jgi:hypothetical protein
LSKLKEQDQTNTGIITEEQEIPLEPETTDEEDNE